MLLSIKCDPCELLCTCGKYHSIMVSLELFIPLGPAKIIDHAGIASHLLALTAKMCITSSNHHLKLSLPDGEMTLCSQELNSGRDKYFSTLWVHLLYNRSINLHGILWILWLWYHSLHREFFVIMWRRRCSPCN
jgi:hypothetical protein